MKNLLVTRTCKIEIAINHKYFKDIDRISFLSKNLYNAALYEERQLYFGKRDPALKGQVMNYNVLYNLMKDTNPDYLVMKGIHSKVAQNIVRIVATTMVSFKKSLSKYYKDDTKYNGKPKPPNYKHKTKGRFILSYDYQSISIRDNFIRIKIDNGYLEFKIPEYLNGLVTPSTKLTSTIDKLTLKQLRIIPSKHNRYTVELVYDEYITTSDIISPDHRRIASIDLGVNNLATITTNISNKPPLIISGKYLKSYNKNFNKKVSFLQSFAKRDNNLYITKRIRNIYYNRNNYYNTNFSQISSYIIKYLKANHISELIVGYNEQWKTESRLSKLVNQTFVQIPYLNLINKLEYRCIENGIDFYLVQEKYTSGTSFLDDELPSIENYNKKRRIHRGLFRTNKGLLINSDVNASLQIMRKCYPRLKAEHIENVMIFNPITVVLPKTFKQIKRKKK